MPTRTSYGALVALVTPLDEARQIEPRDVEVLVARAVEDGASGVVVAGSTGEGALLEPAQRAQLTRIARAAGDGLATSDGGQRPLVVAGASGATASDVEADVERLADAGADLVLTMAPATYPLGSGELVDFHVGVAERTGIPQLIYHIPQFTNGALLPDDLADLASHPRLVGMKDSSPDAERRAAFVDAVAGCDDFAVLTGHGPTLLDALRAGAAGSITAIANLRQRQVVALHAAVAAGDDAEAVRLQAALSRTSAGIDAVGASMPAVIKAALQLDGVVTERWCRPPLQSVPPARLDHVRSALLA